MHLLHRRRPLRKRIPKLLLLLRIDHAMIQPQRSSAVLVTALHSIPLTARFEGLLRRTDMNVVPFPEAQQDAGVDAQGAEELDDGSGGVEVVWGEELFEDVGDLEHG